MGLYYLAFVRKNLDNKEKLSLVHITNSVNMNRKNIVNCFGILNDSDTMNNGFRE